jgi:hypothetical protein
MPKRSLTAPPGSTTIASGMASQEACDASDQESPPRASQNFAPPPQPTEIGELRT